jgi:hypothetical protein
MPEKSINTTQPRRTRAEINRENAKKSTGPKTTEGKVASSKKALKHGIYSKFACIPGEDPEKLDALRADLRDEHQPASLTEEILVDELAHHYWRIQRYRYLESHMWTTPGRDAQGDLCADTQRIVWMIDHGLAALYHRALNSADRCFYRTLKSLQETKKGRDEAAVFSKPKTQSGFVPQTRSAAARAVGAAQDEAAVLSEPKTPFRFVPANAESTEPNLLEIFTRAKTELGLSPSQLVDLLKTAA